MERLPGPGTVAVARDHPPAADAMAPAVAIPDPPTVSPLHHVEGGGTAAATRTGSQALYHQSSLPSSLPGKSSSPKSPNGHHHPPVSPPSHAFKVKASEQFDKSGLVAVQNASLHDAQVLEMGLQTLVVSNPEAQGAAFGEEGLVLEPPKVQDPPAGLKPILLKDMKIGKYHRGRVLHGKLCTKPVKVRTLTTILEDDSGSAIIVLIPKAVPVSCSVAQAERQFPEGARVAICNPYLRRFADKVLGILIEDPRDLIFLFIPELGNGTDSNGDNGELHKYYTEDWQRQVGTVGKDNFSIANGDRYHTTSGSDEDEQDLKDKKFIQTEQHDSEDEKGTSLPAQEHHVGGAPSGLALQKQSEISLEGVGIGSSQVVVPGDKPSKESAAPEKVLQGETAKPAPLLHNEAPGSVEGGATGPGEKHVAAGRSLGLGPETELGEGAPRPEQLQSHAVQDTQSQQSVAACQVGTEGSSIGVDAETAGMTRASNKAIKVAETSLAGENGTHVSLAGSAKVIADTPKDDYVLEDGKYSDVGKDRYQRQVVDAAETRSRVPDAAEFLGSNAVDKAAVGHGGSQNNKGAPLGLIAGQTEFGAGVAGSTSDKKTSLLANVIAVSQSNLELPQGITEVEQSLVEKGRSRKEVISKGEDEKPPANPAANGGSKLSETPARAYDSGPDDLFEYDFKDANTRTTDATGISAVMGTAPGQVTHLESGTELVASVDKLSNGKKEQRPYSSKSGTAGEAENGSHHVDSQDQVTSASTRTKVSGEHSLVDNFPISGTRSGTEKDVVVSTLMISEDSHSPMTANDTFPQKADSALPESTPSGHAQGATERPKPLEISPDGSSKEINSVEGRKESLTLLSLQLNAEPQTDAVQERTASEQLHVPRINEEGKGTAEIGDSSEKRPASPVSSPVIPPNISAYALRVQGNRWFGQGDWKKAVSFYTWGIRQALKEHKATVSAANMDLKTGLAKKKNVQAALSDAYYPTGGSSSTSTTIRTQPTSSKVEGAHLEDEEALGVSAASVSPRASNEILLGFSNRAEAWLRLEQYEKALIDSERALELNSQHLKSVFRKGRALLGLGEFLEALSFLHAAKDRAPSDKDLLEAFQACQIGDKQSRLGVYDLSEYFLKDRFSAGLPVPRCADYVGPVSVECLGSRKGCGLVTTRDVEAGSLLLVSNPLVFVSDSCTDDADPRLPLHTRSSKAPEKLASVFRGQLDASTRNLERILSLCHADVTEEKKLIEGAENVSGAYLNLFAPTGKAYDSSYASAAKKLPLQQQLDSRRISRITHHNAFDRSTLRIQFGAGEQDEGPDAWEEVVEGEGSADHNEMGFKEDEQIYGIWGLPSFMNHSCLPNTSWILVGKAIFVVASQDIVAGKEITFNYFDVLQPLAERRSLSTSGWGFQCTCPRCSLEDKVDCHLEKVKNLYSLSQPEHNLGESSEVANVVCSEVEQVLNSSLQTLTAEEQNWIRSSFVRPYLRQLEGQERSDRDRKQLNSEAFAYLPKCLEALETVCPGSMETMRVSVLARELAKRSNGKKSASYRLANSSSLRICRCTYGKQKTNVLQALVTECRESLARVRTPS